MLTPDDVRRIALSMPEAYEAPHFDIASFRVGKKIFCTIHTKEPRIMLKLDPEDQHNLADGEAIEPVPGYWGKGGSTFVWYEKLDPVRLPDLMRMAWAAVAPKRLLKDA
jgi:predicted DNA-binding protein (MmcQ/YjbR family)